MTNIDSDILDFVRNLINSSNQPVCIYTIGLPGSGKSHLANLLYLHLKLKTLSSDNIYVELGLEDGITPSESFKVNKKRAKELFLEKKEHLFSTQQNFVFDQMNLAHQKQILNIQELQQHNYKILPIIINVQEDLYFKQLITRTIKEDKYIPRSVIYSSSRYLNIGDHLQENDYIVITDHKKIDHITANSEKFPLYQINARAENLNQHLTKLNAVDAYHAIYTKLNGTNPNKASKKPNN